MDGCMSSSPPNGDERLNSGKNSRWFLTCRTPLLRLRVDDVPGESDRATLYPADVADIDRMETWLTVDASAVADLL